jgi:hypothetical protein
LRLFVTRQADGRTTFRGHRCGDFLKVFFRDFGPACATLTGVRCTSAPVIASFG